MLKNKNFLHKINAYFHHKATDLFTNLSRISSFFMQILSEVVDFMIRI